MMQRKKTPSTGTSIANIRSEERRARRKLKSSKSSNMSLGRILFLAVQVLFITVGLGLIFTDNGINKSSSNATDAISEVPPVSDTEASAGKKLRGMQESIPKPSMSEKQIKELKQANELLSSQLDDLKKNVQVISKREVVEKFGEGPHRIEIKLDFPDDDSPNDKFVVEMAPLDLMPLSIYHFMEMVRLQLLDGTAFHRNAGHVVQAGPAQPYAGSEARSHFLSPRRGFTQHQLTSVAFQEYSPKFPHVKYTIGFAGRPGGPDWYVSTIDNTRNHGPGGQQSYAVKSEADPCFGKVVEGFAVVDKMLKQPVKEGGYRAMKKNVGIVYAKLI